MVVAGMPMRMSMGLAGVAVGMYMYQIIFFQKFRIGQELGRRRPPDDPFIVIKDIYHIRDLFDDMHIMRRGNYSLSVGVIPVQKVHEVS